MKRCINHLAKLNIRDLDFIYVCGMYHQGYSSMCVTHHP